MRERNKKNARFPCDRHYFQGYHRCQSWHTIMHIQTRYLVECSNENLPREERKKEHQRASEGLGTLPFYANKGNKKTSVACSLLKQSSLAQPRLDRRPVSGSPERESALNNKNQRQKEARGRNSERERNDSDREKGYGKERGEIERKGGSRRFFGRMRTGVPVCSEAPETPL